MCCSVVTSSYILPPQQPFKVRALRSGMVLVVDEADKAPTHVTCILKNIVEGGEITLADGRRIVQGMAYYSEYILTEFYNI